MMRYHSALLLVATLGTVLTPPALSAGQPPNASQAVDLYEASLSSLRCAEFNVRERAYWRATAAAPEKLANDDHFCVRRSGDLWKVRQDGLSWNVSEDRPEPIPLRCVMVRNAKRELLSAWWTPDNKVDAIVVDRGGRGSDRIYRFGIFAFIYGYLPMGGLPYIPEMLRQATLSTRQDRINVHDCVLLEGSGPGGESKVWLDPAVGYAIRRFELHLRPGDVFRGNKVTYPLSLEITNCEYRTLQGVHIPVSFMRGEESVLFERRTCELTEVNLQPDVAAATAFQLTEPIPNGTRVQVNDELGIDYVWHNGEIVKKIDVDLGRFGGQSFMGGTVPRTLLAISALAVVLAIILLLTYRSRLRRIS